MKREVAICHFNTPELTEATILSLRKHGGENYHVTIFDNSAEADFNGEHHAFRPFTKKMKGVTVIDNTRGQLIDFQAELNKFPDREPYSAQSNDWGSVKHMVTVQYIMDNILTDGFLLLDSDILIKQNVDFMFREDLVAVGHVQEPQPGNRYGIGRLVPMLCWINVPMCKRLGIRYYDPQRCWMLFRGMDNRRNWYDTGASFMEDIRKQPRGQRGMPVDIRPLMEHYKCGSWRQGNINQQKAWLEQHRDLWEPTPRMRNDNSVALCVIGRNENRYAREWVVHYAKLGVKKIFVYDNWFDGETPLAETLKEFVQSGFVEIFDLPNRMDMQIRAFNHCYKHHGNEYGWIGFLDFDEFLRWKGRKKIETMFKAYDHADCVLVNWRIMTDNGLTKYDPRPLAVRFTKPMPLDRHVKYDFPENNHVKCFVRGGMGDVTFQNPHFPHTPMTCVNAKGEHVQQGPFVPYEHSVMRIDHYWTKTAEEWRNVKLKRGFATGRKYDQQFMEKQTDYFFAVNERTAEKELILNGE